jgi:hypothetical protein
MSSIYEESEFE